MTKFAEGFIGRCLEEGLSLKVAHELLKTAQSMQDERNKILEQSIADTAAHQQAFDNETAARKRLLQFQQDNPIPGASGTTDALQRNIAAREQTAAAVAPRRGYAIEDLKRMTGMGTPGLQIHGSVAPGTRILDTPATTPKGFDWAGLGRHINTGVGAFGAPIAGFLNKHLGTNISGTQAGYGAGAGALALGGLAAALANRRKKPQRV